MKKKLGEQMFSNWKVKEFIATVASLFGRSRTSRRKIRDKIRFKNIISYEIESDFPKEKLKDKINVAFCFDEKGHKLAAVSIKSLLKVSENKCDYNIYCVIDKKFPDKHKKTINNLVIGTKSKIVFLQANTDFNKSFRAKWPVSVFWRLMLPNLLPKIKKIIYADIDIIFRKPLIDVYNINMGKNIFAGVKDYKNGYINSGFLVMNLDIIRKEKIYQKWVQVSQKKKYINPDQDLLNYTCRGRIIYLPLKYNFQPMMGSWIFKVHTDQEIHDLKYNLVVLHYSNWMKPWHEEKNRPVFSELWWDVAKQTKLF